MPPENDIAPHIKTIIENVRSALSSVTLSLAGAEAEPPADRLKQLGAECDQALAQIRAKMKASVIEVWQLAERTDATALAAQVESLRNEAATKNVRVKEVMDALHSVLLTLRTWQDAQTPAAK